jgi:hypothetical protein
MMRATLMLAALLAAGCDGGASDNVAGAIDPAKTVEPAPAAPPRPSSVPAPDCAPVPTLELSDSFGASAELFSPDSSPYQRTEAAFEAAYRQSCANGLLREAPLFPPDAAEPGTLLLKNAPDANIASLYRESDADRSLVLEYPFVSGEGAARVPTEEELGEAIYCSVRGASGQEQEESGRCLAD